MFHQNHPIRAPCHSWVFLSSLFSPLVFTSSATPLTGIRLNPCATPLCSGPSGHLADPAPNTPQPHHDTNTHHTMLLLTGGVKMRTGANSLIKRWQTHRHSEKRPHMKAQTKWICCHCKWYNVGTRRHCGNCGKAWSTQGYAKNWMCPAWNTQHLNPMAPGQFSNFFPVQVSANFSIQESLSLRLSQAWRFRGRALASSWRSEFLDSPGLVYLHGTARFTGEVPAHTVLICRCVLNSTELVPVKSSSGGVGLVTERCDPVTPPSSPGGDGSKTVARLPGSLNCSVTSTVHNQSGHRPRGDEPKNWRATDPKTDGHRPKERILSMYTHRYFFHPGRYLHDHGSARPPRERKKNEIYIA